jgi:hypothetical protein
MPLQVTIPFFYSTAGYGFLANMPGSGSVSVGGMGQGGTTWSFDADVGIDLWVSTLPEGVMASAAAPIYSVRAVPSLHFFPTKLSIISPTMRSP